MTEMPQIVEDRRQGERRADWHTPDTCPKVNEFQDALDSIFEHLKDGRARMEAMEKAIFENNRIATESIERLEKKQDVNNKDTATIAEILEMGRGFFKTVFFAGKWTRRIIMKVAPPITAVLGLWYAIKQWSK